VKTIEFQEKQFDGPYEVSEVQIKIDDQILRGILYFPPERFARPYPLIIYFHGFPQLFTLEELIKNYDYLLNEGYSLLVFNFRGYRISEGKVSIESQVKDATQVLKFVKLMAKKKIFEIENINILAHDFGAFIALIACSKESFISKLLLLSPIIDVSKRVNDPRFVETLQYINKFLPGNVSGIENVEEFIKKTKEELKKDDFNLNDILGKVKCNHVKIIWGEKDKLTSFEEIEFVLKNINANKSLTKIKSMDHYLIDDAEINEVKVEIIKFFKLS